MWRQRLTLVGSLPSCPLPQWAWKNYDDLIMDLQRRAHEAALRLVAERATVIRAIGNELCDNK